MAGKTTFDVKIADAICDRIALGESLATICRDAAMPAMSTVFKWLSQQPTFAESYTRAREQQAEAFADEIVAIADQELDPQRARVRVDARKWVAAKLKPKVYGDKVQQEVSGPDGGPVQVALNVNFIKPESIV